MDTQEERTAAAQEAYKDSFPLTPPVIAQAGATATARFAGILATASITRITTVDVVKRWKEEWLASNEPHWGDKIEWNSAVEIAERIDRYMSGER